MVSEVDYRRLAQHRRGLYFTGEGACKVLQETFETLTNKNPIQPTEVAVQMGRTLAVPKAGGCHLLYVLRVWSTVNPKGQTTAPHSRLRWRCRRAAYSLCLRPVGATSYGSALPRSREPCWFSW